MSTILRVQSVVKYFGGFAAVDGIDFDVLRGEVFGFLGPNGAGKSTTMRMVAGLLRPSAGRIEIDGHDLADEPLAAKAVTAFIPDRPFLYDKLTGLELLRFVGGLYGMGRQDVSERGAELLDVFGLTDWADRLVETYSHGMKQRLAFSAAMLPRPKLLIVDEPMVGLDPRGAKLVKHFFRRLSAEQQLAVFLSTHTMSVAQEVCDRIAIIHHGKIVALGTMDELRIEADRPGSALEDIFLALTEEHDG
ncbi:MAG: ABC transporter ATP-binding protein [Acidobacteria bacterium]|nr:ABC transporter ATP-binding protein [Acidobacteriota bacterium]